MMRYLLFIFCFSFLQNIYGQQFHDKLPELSYKEYGFEKPVTQSIAVYYYGDSLGYEPKSVEFHKFNEDNCIQQRVLQILGKYQSETIYNYVYKEGLLDSLNVLASAAAFSNFTHYIYNDKQQLVKSVCTGKYTNYTKDYFYDSNGKLVKINFNHKNGNNTITNFVYKNGEIDYVEKVEKIGNEPVKKTLFYYFNKELLASSEVGSEKVTLYTSDFGELKREIEGDIEKIVKSYRNGVPEKKPSEKPFLKDAKVLFQVYDTKNMDGDWIKRYQTDYSYGQKQIRYVFRKLTYKDGVSSGSTDFDSIFQIRMKKILSRY